MKNVLSTIAIVLIMALVIFLMFSLVFSTKWLSLEWEKYWAPREAAVEREVFKETRSYNEGMIQQLTRFRMQYKTAKTEEEKDVIASTVRHMFAEYDADSLPNQDLRNFIREVNE